MKQYGEHTPNEKRHWTELRYRSTLIRLLWTRRNENVKMTVVKWCIA